jgi:activator of HSP90 ATPase
MTDTILLEDRFPIHPDLLYNAWLDSGEHSAFTGSEASIDPQVGGGYTAWNKYIHAVFLDLQPGERILQKWRTTDFPEHHQDSVLEIQLQEIPEGCLMRIIHTGLPSGTEEEYKKGWVEYYLKPMKQYFK